MKNTLTVIGLIVFTVYLCGRNLPPTSDCVSNHKKASLSSMGKSSLLTKNEPTKNWITHHKPMHNHIAMEIKLRNYCIEMLKVEQRDEDKIEESPSNSKRGQQRVL